MIDSIVSKNWKSVQNGEIGAINGIRKNGKFITSVPQAEELWVGINYCIASLFILEVISSENLMLLTIYLLLLLFLKPSY